MNSNSGVADINKVNASDLNEIKSTINGIDAGTDIVNNLVVGSVKTKNLFDSSTLVQGDIINAFPTLRISSRQALWLEAGTYTLSTNLSSTYRFDIQVQSTGVPPLSSYPTYIYDSGWQTSSPKTFTISSSGYFNILLSRTDNTAFSTSDISNLYGFQYQLESGSSASTYTSYQNLTPEVSDSGWVDLTLINSVSQRTGAQYKPQIRKIGKVVYMKGQITIPSHNSYLIGFYVPQGFRPAYEIHAPQLIANNWLDTAGAFNISADSTQRTNQDIQSWWTVD